jgi:hydrogenase maturation protease
MSRILVLAWGNPSRGDDALGPSFAERAEALLSAVPHAVEIETDFQLSPEHATDLLGRDVVLFVDASLTAPPPFTFDRVVAARDRTWSSHAMSPAALLAAYESAFGRPAPAAFVLALRGERFDLGAPTTASARRHLDAAIALLRRLLAVASTDAWADIVAATSA